jgi:hypothetical protein
MPSYPQRKSLPLNWAKGAQACARASGPSAAQTRAACPWNDFLPQGTAAEGHPEYGAPAAHAEKRRWRRHRLWVDSLDGLLGLVALGAVELHPWNARVENFERADRLVIDLDPGEGVPWEAVVEAALRMREILQGEGLSTWPKLTGGKAFTSWRPSRNRSYTTRRIATRPASSGPSLNATRTITSSLRRITGEAGYSSTIYVMAAARRRSAPFRRACAKASRSPPLLPGRASKPA